jgi:hypothetical protein
MTNALISSLVFAVFIIGLLLYQNRLLKLSLETQKARWILAEENALSKNAHLDTNTEISTGTSSSAEVREVSQEEPPVEENESWRQHAYPLFRVDVTLQGTRHSKHENVFGQMETVLERLKKGEVSGCDHDDDFGYKFVVTSDAYRSAFIGGCGYE